MGRRGRPPYPDILTPREWEVLALLREGLTNEAIAARLGVTHAAAKYHVSQILSKLGVATREEAAAWVPAPAEAAAEAGKPRLRWWGFGVIAGWLRPVTVGKAALIGAAVAVVAGLGVLVWGVLRDAGGSEPIPKGRIAFVSDRDGDYDIWVINEDGSSLTKLTDFGVNPGISNLFWSEDGRYVVFNEGETVYASEVDAQKTWAVTDEEETASAQGFEPGGHRILVGVDGATWSMGLYGEQRQLVFAETVKLVSSKGERLEVAAEGSPGFRYYAAKLLIYRAGSNEAVQLAPDLGVADLPAWSPDGSLIVFRCVEHPVQGIARPATPMPGDIDGICTIRPDGSGLTKVVHGATGLNGATAPQWSPDGSWLIYLRPLWRLRIARPNGSEERRLTDCECQESSPAWWQPAADAGS